MNETYNRYKKLKSSLSIKYRGIDISQVLAIYLWVWAEAKAIDGVEEKETEQALCFSFLQGIEKKRIAYFDIDRKDHQATFHDICSRLNDDYEVIDIAFNVKYKPHRSRLNKWLSRLFALKAARQYPLSEKEKTQLSYRICFVLNSIDELHAMRRKLRHITHFVSYSAIHPWNSLLCQFFMQQHTKVFGLSHAVHYVYTQDIPIHCLNYENLNVDNSLTWGQYTRDEYQSYAVKAKKIFVAGYPKKTELRQAKKANGLKTCLVLLSNPDYEASNLKLLDVLSGQAEDFIFSLKLHPSCDFDLYSQCADKQGMNIISRNVQLTECFDNEKYDFAIAVNTTSYYEIIAAGIPCLRYRDDQAYQLSYGMEKDTFSNAVDFVQALDWLREAVTNDIYNDAARQMLHYAMGIGEDRYEEFLSKKE